MRDAVRLLCSILDPSSAALVSYELQPAHLLGCRCLWCCLQLHGRQAATHAAWCPWLPPAGQHRHSTARVQTQARLGTNVTET